MSGNAMQTSSSYTSFAGIMPVTILQKIHPLLISSPQSQVQSPAHYQPILNHGYLNHGYFWKYFGCAPATQGS